MNNWKKESHGDSERVTLNPKKTLVPIYVVGSAIGLAVYGTVLYERVMTKLDDSFTTKQAQTWVDNAREDNRGDFPSLIWPRIPPKEILNEPQPKM